MSPTTHLLPKLVHLHSVYSFSAFQYVIMKRLQLSAALQNGVPTALIDPDSKHTNAMSPNHMSVA